MNTSSKIPNSLLDTSCILATVLQIGLALLLSNMSNSQSRTGCGILCIISWKGLYPIGAIIGVHKSSENQRSGLKILEIQHAVRKLYTLKTAQGVIQIFRVWRINCENL
jgi:hypothetical protein